MKIHYFSIFLLIFNQRFALWYLHTILQYTVKHFFALPVFVSDIEHRSQSYASVPIFPGPTARNVNIAKMHSLWREG